MQQWIAMVVTVGGMLVLAGVADIGLALASDLLDVSRGACCASPLQEELCDDAP